MIVKNQCRLDFDYKFSHESPIIAKTIFSNIVSTNIINDILKVEKYVDKLIASVYSILTYTIVISNISKFDLNNIYFKDKIPIGTRFIKNSLIINNVKKRCISPNDKVYIGEMKTKCKTVISFKVLVLSKVFSENIKNNSIVHYDYFYNIEKPPTSVSIKSNEVSTLLKNKVFKQISINNTIKSCNCIDEILDTKTKVDIVKTKTISSVNCNSEFINCTILLIGVINYEILYKSNKKVSFSNKKREDNYILKDSFGFSSFIVVPIGITYGYKDCINIMIENVSSNIINENNIFLNTALLVHY